MEQPQACLRGTSVSLYESQSLLEKGRSPLSSRSCPSEQNVQHSRMQIQVRFLNLAHTPRTFIRPRTFLKEIGVKSGEAGMPLTHTGSPGSMGLSISASHNTIIKEKREASSPPAAGGAGLPKENLPPGTPAFSPSPGERREGEGRKLSVL